MSRRRVFAFTAGVLLSAGACVSSQGLGTLLDNGVPDESSSRALTRSERDSVIGQAIADQAGPRISIYAELTNADYVGARRVRAHFTLDDDAYLVIGQIDADGVVRIVFPNGPADDGFVRGHRSYQTAEFFAGFTDNFRYRYTTMFRRGLRSPDAYDGAVGYVFAIASWRPMRFDQISTGGAWDDFELTDADYLRDPRPAVYELASVLAGANREAYTVKFARYSDTRTPYTGNYRSSAFGYGYCAGFAPIGFATTPFDIRYIAYGFFPYGESFVFRGTPYLYSAAGDCYYTLPGGYRYGYRIAQGPPNQPQTPVVARRFDLEHRRSPITPQPPPAHRMPANGTANDAGSSGIAQTSPLYRERGLLSAEDPGATPRRREPALQSGLHLENERPSIQEMTSRRAHETGGVTRGELSRDDGFTHAISRPVPSEQRPRLDSPGGESRAGSYNRPQPADRGSYTPRAESPRVESPHAESPRVQAPRSEAPRSVPAPRVESPRSSPPPARSEPASSSGSKPVKDPR
jgi:hypothetical protein